MRWLGRHFSELLRSRRTRPAWAAELAAFEWAVGEVLDSADTVPMSITDMAEVPAEQWPKQTLDKPEAWALRALQRGETLAHVGSSLLRAGVPSRQVPAQLVTCLQRWLGDCLICAPDQDLGPDHS